MGNSVARVCKGAAIIIGIILFIMGIVVGKSDAFDDFSWRTAFMIWTSGFLFCLLLFTLGEITEKLSSANDYLQRLYENENRKDAPQRSTGAAITHPQKVNEVRNIKDTWKCKHCGAHNDNSTRICRTCGKDK